MLEPILLASLSISTIMLLTMFLFRRLINSGVPILSTGSLATTMPSYPDLTLGFFNPAAKRLTPFARTGEMITIGSVPQFASLLEFSNTWNCVRRGVH